MRKKITKQVVTTKIHIKKINVVDGDVRDEEMKPLFHRGRLSMERANKLANRAYPGMLLAVTKLETKVDTYEMDLDEFIERATLKE